MAATLEAPRRRVAVADDVPEYLQQKSTIVELAGFEAVPLRDKYPRKEDLLQAIKSARASALVCDHKLREGNYAGFDGAEAVASLYESDIPAILVTDYVDSDLKQSIRKYLRRVPVLVRGSELKPSVITKGIRDWEQEVLRKETPLWRRPRRTSVEIDEIVAGPGGRMVTVFVPRWREHEAIMLSEDMFPEAMRPKLRKGAFLLANVNTDAERIEDLYFDDFETTPDEDLTNEPA